MKKFEPIFGLTANQVGRIVTKFYERKQTIDVIAGSVLKSTWNNIHKYQVAKDVVYYIIEFYKENYVDRLVVKEMGNDRILGSRTEPYYTGSHIFIPVDYLELSIDEKRIYNGL